jgi:hypothetical protein
MNLTLLDEHGVELTEISSDVGGSPGQMLVDRATRPDLLFRYYFDRGQRNVTLVREGEHCAATLGTQWQMGARSWFVRELLPGSAPPQLAGQARFKLDYTSDVAGIPSFLVKQAGATIHGPALAPVDARQGVAT